mmetsp:Transcript_66275/g.205339  ORF Transcript_66275/g.205339 Transcript_66275/m.205339 type:complete len:245 (+) Transcript_66275:634-1368(+)
MPWTGSWHPRLGSAAGPAAAGIAQAPPSKRTPCRAGSPVRGASPMPASCCRAPPCVTLPASAVAAPAPVQRHGGRCSEGWPPGTASLASAKAGQPESTAPSGSALSPPRGLRLPRRSFLEAAGKALATGFGEQGPCGSLPSRVSRLKVASSKNKYESARTTSEARTGPSEKAQSSSASTALEGGPSSVGQGMCSTPSASKPPPSQSEVSVWSCGREQKSVTSPGASEPASNSSPGVNGFSSSME